MIDKLKRHENLHIMVERISDKVDECIDAINGREISERVKREYAGDKKT